MTTQSKALSILRSMQADILLEGLPILKMLQGLRAQMVYRDQSCSDYFDKIQSDIGQLGHLQLQADVDPLSASSYLVDLAMGYERTLDDINRVTVEAQAFLGKLRVLHNRALNLKAPFMVWWSIGAGEILAASTSVKINATDMKALAASEFTGLVDEADMELAAMVEAMELTLDNLKNLRKLAQDKYAIGKDQVNAALSALDFDDKGIGPDPRSHKPAPSDTATMQGMFGARVKAELQPATGAPALAEGEDDFPHEVTDLDELDEPPTAAYVQAASEPIPNGGIASEAEEEHFQTMEAQQLAAAKMSEHPGQENLDPVDLDAPPTLVDAGMSVVTPDNPEAAPAGETTTSTPDLPVLEKPGKGKAVVVPYHVHVLAPGHTPNVPGLLFGVGKTKLELTAQTDSAENGVYRWHGPDAPLVRIETKAEDAPGPATAPKPPTLVTPDAHAVVPAPPEPTVTPKTTPQVVTPDAKALIQSDPFLSEAQKTEMVAKLDEEDDFPAVAGIREEAFEGTGTAVVTAKLDEEDDFPTSAPEANTQAPLDDDDDFPVGAEIIDRTPKPEDAETSVLEEKAPETLVLEAPAPEQPKTTAPKPDPAVAAPKPGGLFRSRVLPPNQTAAPAFRPSKPVEGVQVTGDGLDEVL